MAGLGLKSLGGLSGAAGIAGNAIGAVGDVIGAFGQKKLAKKQLQEGTAFANQQKLDYEQTYGDLMNMAQNQATYKGDISQYTRAEQEARRQQMMAQGADPADQLYREQANKTSANTFARGARGARSAADLMSLAGMTGAQENQQMQGISLNTANRAQSQQQQANQSMISSIAQTAAAAARERGMEFESILGKSNRLMDLTKEKGLGAMDLAYNQQQEQFARQGAVQDAKSAIYSGFGDIFRSIGGGISAANMQNQQMSILRSSLQNPSTGTSSSIPSLFNNIGVNSKFNSQKPNTWGAPGVPIYDPNFNKTKR